MKQVKRAGARQQRRKVQPPQVRDITRTELAILRLLWRRGPSTIRSLTDTLYREGSHSQYATVQSLLDRLELKGCVARDRQGRVNVFSATVSRGEVISGRLRELADAVCDGSLAPLLTHLVKGTDLSEEELTALSSLVERLGGGKDPDGERPDDD
jgi:predicted transcriptional regulator